MLKLVDDLMASESRLLTVSVLLYLGAAFDTVVMFAVTHQNVRERESYGEPQGSVLGAPLFQLYMLPLGDILRKCTISHHLANKLLKCTS